MLKTKSFLIVEFIGSFFLTGVVIGSGIMAENLSQGNDALALLGNTIATGAILFVLIKSFSPVSGAHFNPVVSLVLFIKKEMEASLFLIYNCSIFWSHGFSHCHSLLFQSKSDSNINKY